MALKIKKPNYLNSSLISKEDINKSINELSEDHPFIILNHK